MIFFNKEKGQKGMEKGEKGPKKGKKLAKKGHFKSFSRGPANY